MKKDLIKNILILQVIIAFYTLSSVVSKFASGEDFLTFKFVLFYGIEILILGVYAIFWQQIIKKFEISVAYANKAMALLWSMLWAIIFFHEEITIKNVIGVIIVIIGTLVINSEESKANKVITTKLTDENKIVVDIDKEGEEANNDK